jgi:hypothetical protein
MLLNELFDADVKFHKSSRSRKLIYTFSVGGSWFKAILFKGATGSWNFEFSDESQGNEETGITGKGNAIKIFATIRNIVKDAIEDKQIDSLIFHADSKEPSRVKLYDRFMKEFKQAGWQVQKTARSGMIFYIVRKQDGN